MCWNHDQKVEALVKQENSEPSSKPQCKTQQNQPQDAKMVGKKQLLGTGEMAYFLLFWYLQVPANMCITHRDTIKHNKHLSLSVSHRFTILLPSKCVVWERLWSHEVTRDEALKGITTLGSSSALFTSCSLPVSSHCLIFYGLTWSSHHHACPWQTETPLKSSSKANPFFL